MAPSTAYHPQTDSHSEIANTKVDETIRAFANYKKDNWGGHLLDFEVAYNCAVNSTTLCSPFFIIHGIHPKLIPLGGLFSNNTTPKSFIDTIHDATRFAYDHIVKKNEKMAQYANKSRITHTFKVGDKVWLSTKNLSIEDGSGIRKVHPRFCGPFQITEKINNVTFRLNVSDPMRAREIHDAFHCSLLKHHVSDKFHRYDESLPSIKIQNGVDE